MIRILTLLFAAVVLAPAAEEKRPNILIISIDDLNDWVGCIGGHPNAKTPNIDRLANRGTLFYNTHCQAPIYAFTGIAGARQVSVDDGYVFFAAAADCLQGPEAG